MEDDGKSDLFQRERVRQEFEREDRAAARVFMVIVLGCIATILLGLSITLPWLGIPITILFAMFWWLGR